MRRHAAATYIAALLLALAAGCGGPQESATGKLQVTSGSGETAMNSNHPVHEPVTFGDTRLCVKGGPVKITGVTFDVSVRPEKLKTSAWVVNNAQQGGGLSSYVGTPEEFLAEGYPGVLKATKNLKVANSCPEKSDSFVSILVTAQASAEGAKFSNMVVHYRSGGESRTASADWTYIFCGSATSTEKSCQ